MMAQATGFVLFTTAAGTGIIASGVAPSGAVVFIKLRRAGFGICLARRLRVLNPEAVYPERFGT